MTPQEAERRIAELGCEPCCGTGVSLWFWPPYGKTVPCPECMGAATDEAREEMSRKRRAA